MKKQLGIFVKNSSRKPIINGFKHIKKKYLPKDKLITKSNQLRNNAIRSIKNHNNVQKQFTLKQKDVSTYIAASSLSHLLDGWGYLSNSVNALLNGNKGISIHLAYYAELRAVMSFLASEGIGVFNRKHIGLMEEDNFEIFSNKPTHIFAWEALKKWCQSSIKFSDELLKIFIVKDLSFYDLSAGFCASPIIPSQIAKKWIVNWAFDVKKFKNDRNLRNDVSYRPQTIFNFENRHDFKNTINDIFQLFHVLSPLSNNPFNLLDLLLLKDLFTQLYTDPTIQGQGSFEELVNKSFISLGATLDRTTSQFLLSPTTSSNHIILEHSKRLDSNSLSVISRAILLLRVSTGLVSKLMKDSDISKNELKFVWDNYGFNNGLWDAAPIVDDLFNLWTDVENDYDEISEELGNTSNSMFMINDKFGAKINRLSQFNRAVLWGL